MINTPSTETLRAYSDDWRRWCTWCEPRDIDPMRCTVSALTDCLHEWRATGLSPSTVTRRKAAIGYYHRQAGAPAVVHDYTIRAVMSEMHRSARPQRGKTPLRRADLLRIVEDCEADQQRMRGLRDRAIFVVAWWCALSRAAIEVLRITDLSSGHRLDRLPADARRMVLEWVQAARIVDGPLFRCIVTRRLQGRWHSATEIAGPNALSSHSIATIIKRRCAAIGKASAFFSTSSVRSGRLAHEVRRGTDVRDILGLARVHSLSTVVRRVGPEREAKTA
jgi:hypothetical protein